MQGVAFAIMLSGLAIAATSWQKEDPSQWTTEDVYKILNNSPWSKSVTVTSAMATTNQVPGLGRGGWGGLGGGGMGPGMGRGRGAGYPPPEARSEVVIQWQSALPVRLAEAKQNGASVDPATMKPLNEYVIAVLGLPKARLTSQAAPGSSNDNMDDAQIAERLKEITALSVGHEQLNPTKVELDQGRDGRTVFHFERPEPITLQDKDVEFRITGNRMEVRKKFALKDMQFQGKLAL